MKRTQLIETIQWRLDTANVEFKEWLDKMASSNDPAYEFRWGEGAMLNGARVSVLRRWLAALQSDRSTNELAAELQAEVLRGARHAESSTSQISNVAARAVLAVSADLLEQFNEVVD